MALNHESWLFVPAVSKYIGGNHYKSADNVIFDLEDSIKPEQKECGLQKVVEYINTNNSLKPKIYVRINSGSKLREEVEILHNLRFEGYMIPKFESAEPLEAIESVRKEKKIIALIESTAGIINLPKYAGDSRITGLAFGAEDFCKELDIMTNENATIYARSQIVLYAAYYKKICLDTVCFDTSDVNVFIKQYQQTMSMGFTSKLLIHPNQVDYVNSLKTSNDINKIRNIINEFYKSSEGVVNIDGKWYERPHILKLEKELRTLEREENVH